MNPKSNVMRLSNLLDGLEAIVASDPLSRSDNATDIRTLVADQIAAHGFKPSSVRSNASKSRGRIDKSEVSDRVKLIRSLIGGRTDLPSTLRAVFSGSRKPTDRELDRAIDDLTRLGFFKKKRIKRK